MPADARRGRARTTKSDTASKTSASTSGRRRPGSSPSARDRAPTPARRDSEEKRPGRPAAPAAKKRGKRRPSKAPTHDHAASEREEREGVRLQKLLAAGGIASRRRAEELIVSGQVRVNGEIVRELGTRVFPGRDRVTVQGEEVRPEAKVYYVLNKPDAVVCSAAGSVDERGRPTVLSLMHGIRERVYPVGRLDFHSRGVVLLTNDGEFAEALTHPRHGVVKTYHVKFQGKLTPDEEQALRDGVQLEDGTITRPLAELFAFRETDTNAWYQIGLMQGLNRQLRRMGEAIGHPVLKLLRVAVGDITTDGLEEGEFRPLTSTEVGQLLAAVRLAPEGKPRRASKPRASGSARVGKPARASDSVRASKPRTSDSPRIDQPARSSKPSRANEAPTTGKPARAGKPAARSERRNEAIAPAGARAAGTRTGGAKKTGRPVVGKKPAGPSKKSPVRPAKRSAAASGAASASGRRTASKPSKPPRRAPK